MRSNATVLLVKGDDEGREVMESWLEASGFDVITCLGPLRPDRVCAGERTGRLGRPVVVVGGDDDARMLLRDDEVLQDACGEDGGGQGLVGSVRRARELIRRRGPFGLDRTALPPLGFGPPRHMLPVANGG